MPKTSSRVLCASAFFFALFVAVRAASDASTLYVMNADTTISSFDDVTNTLTTVADVSPTAGSGLQNLAQTSDGLLYFINGTGELYRFNPATPVTAPVAIGQTTQSTSPARLAADALGRLVTVDPTTTTITYISPTTGQTTATYALTGTGTTSGGDIAVAPNGTLYEVSGTSVLTFAPTGGAITTLSTASESLGGNLTAVAFDPQTGVLIGGVGGGPPSSYVTINQSTGISTLLFTNSSGGTINDLASLPTYPKLAIAKSHAGTFGVGGSGTYSLVVSNSGSFPTSGTISVSDTLPTGLTYNAATGTGWSCSAAGQVVTCTSSSAIAAGANAATISLVVNVVGPAANVSNSATASGGGQPVILGNPTATDPTSLVNAAQLTVTKSAPASQAVGGLIAYSVLLSNTGPSPAGGTTFTDPVPAGLTIEGTPTCAVTSGSATCGSVTVTGQTVSSTVTSLPSASSVTFTIYVKATSAANYTNVATIAPPSGTTDTNATTTSSAATNVTATSGGFTKTVQNITGGESSGTTADTANPGDVLQYALTFTNATGAALGGIALTDDTPQYTSYVAGSAACTSVPTTTPATTCTATATASPTGPNPNRYVISFTISGNTLAANAAFTVVFRVRVN